MRIGAVEFVVRDHGREPPFRQLENQITEAVRRGTLPPGTRLPAVRTFAADVGVAATTAAKVYRELESAGILETRGRSGTFVAQPDAGAAAVARAAVEFADVVRRAGVSEDDAVQAVREALLRG